MGVGCSRRSRLDEVGNSRSYRTPSMDRQTSFASCYESLSGVMIDADGGGSAWQASSKRISAALSEHHGRGGASSSTGLQVRINDGETASVEELEPAGFAALRRAAGVPEDFRGSLRELTGGTTQASGKSGSLFWFTADRRYVLKDISKKEMRKLLELLPRYASHFRGGAQSRGEVKSLLPVFAGAYIISFEDDSRQTVTREVVAMNNVFPGDMDSLSIYDLKGTTEDRWVQTDPNTRRVMKDLNHAGRHVCLPEHTALAIKDALDRDTEFLRAERLMDYSLLLGVCPQGSSRGGDGLVLEGHELVLQPDGSWKKTAAEFRMGVIDILVEWTAIKKAAHLIKKPTIGWCHQIDTEYPNKYQQRFMACMEEKITHWDRHADRPAEPRPTRSKPGPIASCLAICQ